MFVLPFYYFYFFGDTLTSTNIQLRSCQGSYFLLPISDAPN